MLENERLRLGELRKKHYEIAGVSLEQFGQDDNALSPKSPSSPKPSKPSLMKKPALAQKPNIPTKNMVRLLYSFISISSNGMYRIQISSDYKGNGNWTLYMWICWYTSCEEMGLLHLNIFCYQLLYCYFYSSTCI